MCTGYANDGKVWGCDEARSQRERMMNSWSQLFEESLDELAIQAHASPEKTQATSADRAQQNQPVPSPLSGS